MKTQNDSDENVKKFKLKVAQNVAISLGTK